MPTNRILLIVSGGIAAYKTPELVRLIKKSGYEVRVILTSAAKEFVAPMTLATLSGEKVYEDLFDLKDESEIGHIQLSREADLVVVAPATANLIAKLAHGIADNLATTCLLATNKPVMIAPAMNVKMWAHPTTQANIKKLQAQNITFIGPETGDMACGEFGEGRMAESEDINHAVLSILDDKKNELASMLAGKKILVTAGPTAEPIDPVRVLTNHSSGKQGYAIAHQAAQMGAQVYLVSGPTCLSPPQNIQTTQITTAREMLQACLNISNNETLDFVFCVAAVSDWRPATARNKKIKKQKGQHPPVLKLEENPDILRTLSTLPENRPQFIVGFAAETDNIVENAQKKLRHKHCDLIVANEISAENSVFGSANNKVYIIGSQTNENWPMASKTDIARQLLLLAKKHLDARKS